MVNFRRLADQAKSVVDKRGGVDSLKQDAEQLRGIAKGKGSLSDKAKAAADALKQPGDASSGSGSEPGQDSARASGGPQDPEAKGSSRPASKTGNRASERPEGR